MLQQSFRASVVRIGTHDCSQKKCVVSKIVVSGIVVWSSLIILLVHATASGSIIHALQKLFPKPQEQFTSNNVLGPNWWSCHMKLIMKDLWKTTRLYSKQLAYMEENSKSPQKLIENHLALTDIIWNPSSSRKQSLPVMTKPSEGGERAAGRGVGSQWECEEAGGRLVLDLSCPWGLIPVCNSSSSPAPHPHLDIPKILQRSPFGFVSREFLWRPRILQKQNFPSMLPFHTLFKIVLFQTEIKSTKTMRLSHKQKKNCVFIWFWLMHKVSD